MLALLTTLWSVAGNRLELKDITRGMFRGESIAAVQPMADGESYAMLSSDGKRIVQHSFKTGEEVATLFDVSATEGSTIEGIEGYIMSPDGSGMLIQTNTQRIYRHSFTADYYVYTVGNKQLKPLSKGGAQQTPLWSPDSKKVAFVRDNNIFLSDLSGTETQVTRDGVRNKVINGIPDWVNEEEFSNDRSMVFTADGRHVVWVRYDESKVKQYSMTMFKGLKPEKKEFADYPGDYTYKYPIAGEDNSKVTLWCYDTERRKTVQIAVPLDADGYIPRVKMTSEAGEVAVITMNRHQDCLRIYMCNTETSDCQQIIEEKVDRYVRVETLDGIQFTNKHILLPSDRSGWMHLYLYDLNGKLLRQLEDGDYEVSEIYGYDEKSGCTYYASHENGATDQRVWVVRKNGKRECLTPQAGWNQALFSTGCRYFINTWSNLNTPPVITVMTAKGKTLRTVVDNKALQEKLATYELGNRELFTLTTTEGVVLNGWMVKPANFNPAKRYPVVMYQYGGPGNQQVTDRWNIGMLGQGAIMEQYLCQQGYICVCVDNRGTGGRGAAFEKCTYLKLGQLESRDQVEAALWLGRQSYVDSSRIAIWGWSFGGFNTLMSMSDGRPVFRCGIAIAPPTSWRYYDTVYTERYMRTPKENATGYDDCPISRAKKLSGALLLCHGLADDNVHFRNTAEYTEALVQADKDFNQLVYTNRNHSIYGGNTRLHLFRQCMRFFDEKLKPQQTALQILEKVNDHYQQVKSTKVRSFWDDAAYHTGNMEAWKLTGKDRWLKYSEQWAEHNQWQGAKGTDRSKWVKAYKRYGEGKDHVLFADWQICFQTYLDLNAIAPAAHKTARVSEVIDFQCAQPQNDYWWWADALYMGSPIFTKMYKLTGKTSYLDAMTRYYLFADSLMWDKEAQLYFRDGKYIYPAHKTDAGKKDFWARGNGWVLAALAKLLQDMPLQYRHRDFFLQRYRQLAEGVSRTQLPEGYWTRSMADPDQVPGYETSGTAFFCYGLLWGINNGLLDAATYEPVAFKAWHYLTTIALQPDGSVGYVQPIGERAIKGQKLTAGSMTNFGTGAFLLAACEMARYEAKKK